MEPSPELLAVRESLQALVNANSEQPELVDVAVIVYETVSFDDDGETQRRISYTVPTDNFSLSSALGLLDGARIFVRRDVLGDDGE